MSSRGPRSSTRPSVTAAPARRIINASVNFDVEGQIGVLTLDNPPANQFTNELVDDLAAAIEEAERFGLRALLVRGEGPNFCAGADVNIFNDVPASEARHRFSRNLPILHRLENLPFPTVASVQGACIAAGLELALACDLIFAAESAQFAQVEAAIGTATLLGGVQRIAERAGSARAKEIVFTADFYPAAQFREWNIINRVYPDDELARASRHFTHRMATGPTLAHHVTKRMVREYLDTGIRNADKVILDGACALFESQDMQSGVKTLLSVGVANLRDHVTFEGK
jgi:enoyl-CoA hydratase/carnithine racemase